MRATGSQTWHVRFTVKEKGWIQAILTFMYLKLFAFIFLGGICLVQRMVEI